MNKPETIKVLGVIASAYPNMKEITEQTIEVWYHSLKDLEAQAVQIAVQTYILEGTFPPSIAEIRKRAINALKPELPESTEAWGQIQEAVKRYGYAREKEALETMDPVVAKTAKAMGWREICHSTKPDVVRGQFLKMYNTLTEREERDRVIPLELKGKTQELRALASNIGNSMALQ